jgi:cytochrome c553
MDKTPIHDPSMTPSASAPATTGANVLQPKAMIYVCGECHKDNELKSTDVIRCKINNIFIIISLFFFCIV